MVLMMEKPSKTKPVISKYPVHEGSVFRILKPTKIYNKAIKSKTNHDLYIWIQRYNTGKYYGPPKKRPLKVLFLYIPMLLAFKEKIMVRENTVGLDYITKKLSLDGYELIMSNCKYNYSKYSYLNFYKQIGLVPANTKMKKE